MYTYSDTHTHIHMYRWFLITVFSALVGCVLLLIFTLSLFIAFFSARDHIYYACNNHILSANSSCDDAIRVFGADVPDAVFPVLVGVIGLLAVAGIGMIGYLAVFHIYLSKKKQLQLLLHICRACLLFQDRPHTLCMLYVLPQL